MNSGRNQPGAADQGGFDEATLLALVEGVLPIERASVVRETLARGTPEQQRLLGRLDAMKRDRAGIASLAACSVPVGMVEAAMRRAQQDALAGLRIAGEQASEIPVSRVVPVRRSMWTNARRLTAAAAVLGVVGGVGLVAFWPSKAPSGTEVAGNTTNNTSVPSGTNTGTQPSGLTVADPVATTVETTDGSTDGGPDAPMHLATAAPIGPAAVPMANSQPADRAARVLELAKAGRLVLKVTARTPRQCEQRLASLAARPQGSRVWDVSANAPGEVVASLAALSPASSASPDANVPNHEPHREPALAGTNAQPTPMIVKLPEPLPMVIPPGAQDLVGLVRVVPTLDGIESVQRALSDAVGSVTVAELPEAMAGMGVTASQAITLESAIWWSGPPTRWATWASVPVIIER